MRCAVIELIGRQLIILITPLPVEQFQEAVLNFSGWILSEHSCRLLPLISTGYLCCPFVTLGAITPLSLLYSLLCSLVPRLSFQPAPQQILSSTDVNDLFISPELLVREQLPAPACSLSLQLQHRWIRSTSAAATFTLPPPTHSLTATHTHGAGRQAQGPQTLSGSHLY